MKITATLCLKKRVDFETVGLWLEIIRIYFDDIWQKCLKYSRIEFAIRMLPFSCRFAFFINFSSFKPDAEKSRKLRKF